jgi:uncharacterized membrane protein YdjX (TVP38/TMEM64 family)
MENAVRSIGALALIIAVVMAWQNGWFDYLTIENLRRFESTLGPWAPFAFVFAFVFGELIQVPSIFWILCAGLIWPWWFALPVSFVAAMLAATVAFLVARYILGDQFHEKLPKRFRGLNEGLKKSPFKAVLMIRLTTFLHPVVHWILAASPIRLPVFLIGTAIGILPGVVAIIVLGQSFVTWWDEYALWLIAGAIALAIAYVAHQKRSQSQN